MIKIWQVAAKWQHDGSAGFWHHKKNPQKRDERRVNKFISSRQNMTTWPPVCGWGITGLISPGFDMERIKLSIVTNVWPQFTLVHW